MTDADHRMESAVLQTNVAHPVVGVVSLLKSSTGVTNSITIFTLHGALLWSRGQEAVFLGYAACMSCLPFMLQGLDQRIVVLVVRLDMDIVVGHFLPPLPGACLIWDRFTTIRHSALGWKCYKHVRWTRRLGHSLLCIQKFP